MGNSGKTSFQVGNGEDSNPNKGSTPKPEPPGDGPRQFAGISLR